MSKSKFVYLVWHDGPLGGNVVAAFTTEAEAKAFKKKWDKEHSCKWDHASISRKELDASTI